MTIYVDDLRLKANVGRLTGTWSHLFSDVSVLELDEFAARLGLKPSWIQNSNGFIHYDIVESKRQQAIILGATEISCRVLLDYWILKDGRFYFKNANISEDRNQARTS